MFEFDEWDPDDDESGAGWVDADDGPASPFRWVRTVDWGWPATHDWHLGAEVGGGGLTDCGLSLDGAVIEVGPEELRPRDRRCWLCCRILERWTARDDFGGGR